MEKKDEQKKEEENKVKTMEKKDEQEQKQKQEEDLEEDSYSNSKKMGFGKWDCGSTLYDSFELNSFKRHLDSALLSGNIPTRTHSMPHLISHNSANSNSNSNSKHHHSIFSRPRSRSRSRSLIKLVRSVFSGSKQTPQQRNIVHSSNKSNSNEESNNNIINYDYDHQYHEPEKTTRSGRWVLVYDELDDHPNQNQDHNNDQKNANANAKAALSTIPEVPDHDDNNQQDNHISGTGVPARRRLSLSLVTKSKTILSDRLINNTNTNTRRSSSDSTTRILSVSCA